MVSKQASRLAIIMLGSFLSASIMGISPAPLIIGSGSLAAGWALQHKLVKPICKKDMLEAIRDAGSITTKVAFGDAIMAFLESDWQNPSLAPIFKGHTKWFKNGMKFVLYGEIISGVLECLDHYISHVKNSIQNSHNAEDVEEELDNNRVHELVFALQDPVFRKALSYFFFGLANAWITLEISIAFTHKLIPTQEPVYAFDVQGNKIPLQDNNGKFIGYKTMARINKKTKRLELDCDKNPLPLMHDKFELSKKLLSAFAQTFSSSLIKNYVDDGIVYRDKSNNHDELYEKMYLIGIRSYFAWDPFNKLRAELGALAS